jgi:hypothetical protein
MPLPRLVSNALNERTVKFNCAEKVPHELVTVYVIVVVPGATPVTTPLALTNATEGLLLLQAPPGKLLVSCDVAFSTQEELPAIDGDGFDTTTST